MTLKELINSEPLNATRTDQEVLDWLNEGSGKYRPYLINARGLMSKFGAKPAADFLDKLETLAQTNNVVKWAMRFMLLDGIDVGNAQTRAMLDQLASTSVISNGERDGIKGLTVEMTRSETINLQGLSIQIINTARKT